MAKKVLIIEDIIENRYLLSYLLRAHGWEVEEAIDGKSALNLAPLYLPDLILMDIGLPDGFDGYILTGLLRAVPQLNKVPIIAVTSYAMSGDRQMALDAGCNGYIEKPIDPDTFIQQVESVVNKHYLV